ncbi:MAG TPA: MFS transporter [Bacilli bacterium]|nr:MFS transporter [Bacilli bacterium]
MTRSFHYAWIVLLLCFITLLTAQGVRLSFGAFMTPWESSFATDRSVISLVAMLSYLIYGLMQPVVGKLADRYGVRIVYAGSVLVVGVATLGTFFAQETWQLVLLYGVLASFGFGGASNVAGSVAVTNWFAKKRGFAIGLMSAGTAAGQFLMVPLSLFLIEWVGWRQAVLVLGAFLCCVVLPLVWIFLRTSPQEKGLSALGQVQEQAPVSQTKQESVKATPSFFHIMRTKRFWYLALPFFICGVTTSGLIDTHLIAFTELCGFSTGSTGTAVGLLAACNIAGTVLAGLVADRWRCGSFLALLYLTRALSLVLLVFLPGLPSVTLLLVFSTVFGLVDFATVAPTIKQASDFFQAKVSVGVVIGWLFLSHQMGSALGSYLPGLLYDLTGGYSMTFFYAIGLCVIASLLSYSLPDSTTDRTQQEKESLAT